MKSKIDFLSLGLSVIQFWEYVALFEENEIIACKSKNQLLVHARTCARMQAYVERFYYLLVDLN